MALSASEIDAKFGGGAAAVPPAGGPAPKAPGTLSASEIDKKFGGTPAAPRTTASSGTRTAAEIDQLYGGKTAGTTPAAEPMHIPSFVSLNYAFPTTAKSTPMTTDRGTIDDLKSVTSALLSIPKTLYENQVHPDAQEQQIEHFTNVGEGTPLAPITAVPNFAKNVAMRFINPVLKPFAEDVSTAIAGNLSQDNPLAIRAQDLPYTPAMQKNAVQIVGDTAQAVLAAYTPTLLGRSAVATAGGPIKTALLSGARAGAEGGLYFGVAQAASNGSKDPAEIGSTIFMNVTGGALLGAVTSGAIPVARQGYQALTKDIIRTYNLPEKMYIEPDKIRSIFQTGDRISPEELALVKQLGLDGSQYRTAIKEGLTIEVPAENVISITDKPYWAKLKSFFGVQPFSDVTRTVQGAPRQAPFGLLEAPKTTPVYRYEGGENGALFQEYKNAFGEGAATVGAGRYYAYDKQSSSVFGDTLHTYDLPDNLKIYDATKGKSYDMTGFSGLGDDPLYKRALKESGGDMLKQAAKEGYDGVAFFADDGVNHWLALNPNVKIPEHLDQAAYKSLLDITKAHIAQSEGMDINAAIARGDIPENLVYSDRASKTLTAEYAQGRIDDVAQKLDAFRPGLGDQFRSQVDPSHVTMAEIESIGQDVLAKATGEAGQHTPLLPARTGQVEQFNRQLEAPPEVTKALTSPIRASVLATINKFDAPQASAFGRNLIQQITEAAGLDIPGAKDITVPKNVVAINKESADGRPAQFNNGNIEIFIPNVVKDIVALASGTKIQAHEGAHTTVYEKLPNESFEDLATRYVQDIILHEAAHQKTMKLADTVKTQQLVKAVNTAKLEHNDAALVEARKELTAHMQELETRANDYLKTNRDQLAQEFLQPAQEVHDLAGAPRAINRFERQALGIPESKILTRSERTLLRARLRARAQGSREGFSAGKKEGVAQGSQETKSRYQRAIEKIRDRAESQAAKRKELIDYAQILPFRERGKFLKAINNTKTDLNFERVIERIRKASRASERAVLIKAIVKEIKGTVVKKQDGLPKAKFAYDQQKTLNEIRAVQKMSYQDAQIKITQLVSDWQTAHPDEVLPEDILHQIEVLKTAGIKDQTVSELANTLASIQSIKETGRTQKELEREARNERIQQEKDQVLATITGGKELPSDALSIRTRKAKKENFAKTFARESLFGWEELLDKMSQEDITSKPYESYLSRFGGDRANESFNKQNRGELESINQVNELMKKTYGVESKKEILELLGDLQEQHNLGEVKHTDGKMRTLQLSRGEAMQYWMWHQDDALDTTFEETLHWGDDVWNAIDGILTEKDKEMGQALLGWYSDYYQGINKVFSSEYGIDLPFNPNYSPVHRAIDVTIPENVLLAQEIAKYATAKNGSLKDRVKNNIDLKATDAFENVTRHITKMEHYKAWSDTMYSFRRVFGDKQIRTAISDFVGDPYLKLTDNFLNDMARDGVAREKVVQWVDTVRKNATKALLGLNLKVGIKQLTGVLNYGIELPTGSFLSGISDFWTDPIGHATFLFDNSATLQERFGDGFERDLKFAIERGYDKKLAGTKNLSELMFVPIRNADKFTVYMGSWAAYKWGYGEAIKAGKTPEEAKAEGIRQAENITNRVQESSRLDTLAQLQREGSWAKLFTMFQSQPSKYLRVMLNAGRNYRRGRQSAATAAKRIAWAWFVVPFFYNLLADQFIDKKYREGTGGLLMRTLLGPLTEPLIFGQMVQQIYGWTQGENFGYEPSPVFGFMDDVAKAIQQFHSGDAVDGTTYILDTAGKLSGVPSTIVTKPIRNANKASSDQGSAPSGSF